MRVKRVQRVRARNIDEGGDERGLECMGHRVSHGHGVHCPEPRPQGHRPTEPIVPLLGSPTHFCGVLATDGDPSRSASTFFSNRFGSASRGFGAILGT